MPRIREGFPGQRMLVLPRPVVRRALREDCARDLLATDIGYFPDAAWHEVQRDAGASQLIVIYCVRGVGWARINGSAVAVGPGDLLVLPPNVAHAYGSGGRQPWTIYWLHLAGSKLLSLLRLLTHDGESQLFHIGEDAEVLALFEEAFEFLQQSYGPDNLLMASLSIGRLVGRLIVHRRIVTEDDSLRTRIDRTIEFMKRRQDRHVTVPELARLASLSCSHYSATFRKQVGFPPLDYFLRLKMRRACELLDMTQWPIKRIADQLGFRDALYFSRQFRQIHELSPSQYRSLKKG